MYNYKILTVLAVAAMCIVSVRSEEDEKMCPFLAVCLKETLGKVKPEDMKALMTAKLEDLEAISEEVFCVLKCAMEKRQVIVKEVIDIEKLSSDMMMMKHIAKKEDFVECVKKIESIKECGDIKEFMKCKITFSEEK